MVLGAPIQAMGNDVKTKQYMAEFKAKASQPSIMDHFKSAALGTNFITGMAIARLSATPSLNQKIILSSLEHIAVLPTYSQVIVQGNDSTKCGNVTEKIARNIYQEAKELEETYIGPVKEVVFHGSKTDVGKTLTTTVRGRFETTAIEVYMRQTMTNTSMFVGPRTVTVYGADARTSMLRIKLHVLGRVFAYGSALLTNGLFHLEQYHTVGVAVSARIEEIRMLLRNVGFMQPFAPPAEPIYAAVSGGLHPPPPPLPPPPTAADLVQCGYGDESGNVEIVS